MQATKTCGRCKVTKPTDDFHRDKRYGFKSYCKPCAVSHRKAWHKKRPSYDQARVLAWKAANPDKVFAQHLRRYGLTPDQYQSMIVQQENSCAICNAAFSDTCRPHIDHCHERGEVRGLLCGACNLGLGKFEDDARRLIRAAKYLTR